MRLDPLHAEEQWVPPRGAQGTDTLPRVCAWCLSPSELQRVQRDEPS